MFAKSIVVFAAAAATLAPAVLAQDQNQGGDVYNFDCGGNNNYYGYGGGGNNNGGNILENFQDIIDAFTNISDLGLNGSALIRGITADNLPQGSTDLFQNIHDIVCLEQDLQTSLNGNATLTDSEQHFVCHSKALVDLLHNNMVMNIENKASDLLSGFADGSNTPSTLPASVRGWLQAFEPLSQVVNEVAPICQGVQTTSHNIVSGTFDSVLGTLGL